MMKTIKTYLHDYKVFCDESEALRKNHRKGVTAANVICILYCSLIALIYYGFCKSIDKKYDDMLKDINEEEI